MIQIKRNNKIIKTVVSLPSSKSITNRVLMIRELSGRQIVIKNASAAEDSLILSDVLENLPSVIDVKDAGTAFRFLTSFLSIQEGTFILTGSERMKQRPVGELVRVLKLMGAEIEFIEKENCPPLRITGKKLIGGEFNIDASDSSQFISALLLIAPGLPGGLKLKLRGKINSWPYIQMTISLLKYFGVGVDVSENIISVPFQDYSLKEIIIENDWSSASFWYLIAALSDDAEITLKDLSKNSIQGDAVIVEIMKKFGVETSESSCNIILKKMTNFILPPFFEYDFSSCPDLVIPLAVLCAAKKIPSRFVGVKNLRIKESDRLHSIQVEFEKIGIEVNVNDDYFTIESFTGKIYNKLFHSHHDHRVVMSLSALALVFDTIVIDNYHDVNKSYPGFWEQLKSAGFLCDVI